MRKATTILATVIASVITSCSTNAPLSSEEPQLDSAPKLTVSNTTAGGRPFKPSPDRIYLHSPRSNDLTLSYDLMPNFFPMEIGNFWEYRLFSSRASRDIESANRDWGTKKIEIIGSVSINDTTYYEFNDYWVPFDRPIYMRREGLRVFWRHSDRDQLVYEFGPDNRVELRVPWSFLNEEFSYFVHTDAGSPNHLIRPISNERHFGFIPPLPDLLILHDSYKEELGPFYFDKECFCSSSWDYGVLKRAKIGNTIIDDPGITLNQEVVIPGVLIIEFNNIFIDIYDPRYHEEQKEYEELYQEYLDTERIAFDREGILRGNLVFGIAELDSLNHGNGLVEIQELSPWARYLLRFPPDIKLYEDASFDRYFRLDYIEEISTVSRNEIVQP